MSGVSSWIREVWSRLRGSLGRRRLEQDMDEEFRFHLERLAARNVARGMAPDVARREARRQFGGEDRFRESARDEVRSRVVESVLQDMRYALRVVRRNPGFAVATVLTLALGIGANTAIFSVVDGVMLRPLPYPQAERLVYLGWQWEDGNGIAALSAPLFAFHREHARGFDGVATYRTFERDVGDPERFETVRGLLVSEDFLRVLGVAPAQGREFSADERVAGGRNAVIISAAIRLREFGAAGDALGRTLRIGGDHWTVVGVLPPDFHFADAPENADVLLPLRLRPDPQDQGMNYTVIGRLAPGVTREQAQAEMRALSGDYLAEYPDVAAGATNARVTVLSYQDVFVGDLSRVLWVLLGAVGFVLVIACANAANLLLARAAGRARELAVRVAIGAGRRRIVRQLLTESLVLALVAGALGLIIGFAALRTVLAFAPAEIPRAGEIGLDARVLGFTFLVTVLTGTAFGLAGAIPTARSRDNTLRASRGNTAPGRRVREALIIGEAALAVVLLAGAGLLIASFANLRSTDLGFAPENVLAVRFDRFPDADIAPRRTGWESEVLAAIEALPGVEAAAGVSNFPLERGLNLPMTIEGRPDATEGAVEWRGVTPDFFRTMRIPLLRGRPFRPADDASAPRVAIINAAFAARYFPDGNAIGQRVEIGRWQGRWIDTELEGAFEIVGVSGDVREIEVAAPARRTVYVPMAQAPLPLRARPRFVVHTNGATNTSAITERIRAVDTSVPPPSYAPLASLIGRSMAEERFRMVLLGAFAGSALLLTAIGLYGVLSWTARQQTREIGIRMALGARASRVLGRIVAHAMLLVAAGAAIGLLAAFGLTRFLTGMVYGVSTTDPLTFAAALALLALVALTAALLPALRATRVSPTTALRGE